MSNSDGVVKSLNALNSLKQMTKWDTPGAKDLIKIVGDCYWDFPNDRKEIVETFEKESGPEIFMKILTDLSRKGLFKSDSVWFSAYYIYNASWNLTDQSVELATRYSDAGMVKICLANLGHTPYREKLKQKNVAYLIKASLSILHNLAKVPETLHHFREHKAVEKIKFYIKCEAYLKALAMLTLAYVVDEDENEVIMDDTGAIAFIVSMLKSSLNSENRRSEGFCPVELAQGLERLAVNDSNKDNIVEAGALPLLVKMMKYNDPDEQRSAASALWTLSFDESVRECIKQEPGCIQIMEKLLESEDNSVKKAVKGALWIVKKDERPKTAALSKQTRGRNSSGDESNIPHIMISYQWDHQNTVILVKNALQREGYHVWVDVDCMGGSTLEAMADAVERASVVLMCLSEKYKLSPNCRTEAEYSYQLRKDIVPLMMEEFYQPDGWLGILVGTKLYIDFCGTFSLQDQIKKLVRELGLRGKLGGIGEDSSGRRQSIASTSEVVGPLPAIKSSQNRRLSTQRRPQSFPSTSGSGASAEVNEWQNKDVLKWLSQTGLDHCRSLFHEINGRLLIRLQGVRNEAPEFFYNSLKRDIGFKTMVDILKFTDALDELFV